MMPRLSTTGPALPRLYSRKFLAQTLLQTALVLLLIEVIFLTEKLNDVLRSAIDQHASIGSIFLLLLLRTPEIFGLALPLALTIAVYRVTLRFREDRELLILSGMGIGAHQFVWLALALGLAAQVLSLAVSGVVSPAALFAQRQLLFEAHYTALRGGISAGQFYRFGDYTVFAGPLRVKSNERQVFMHKALDREDQVIVANRASLEGPKADGTMILHLRDLTSTSFPVSDVDGNSASGLDGAAFKPMTSTNVQNLTQEIDLSDLFKFDPRGTRLSERTLFELAGTGAGDHSDAGVVAEFGRRVSRSFLCLIAPLIAGLAIPLTNRRTHIVVLPLACAVLMCIDLSFGVLTDAMSEFGAPAIVASLTAITLALFAAGTKSFSSWQSALIKPGLARA